MLLIFIGMIVTIVSYAQTLVKGQAVKQESKLAIGIGAKQYYTEAARGLANGYFISIGTLPTTESQIFYDLNIHYIPSYEYRYRTIQNAARFVTGDTKDHYGISLNLNFKISGNMLSESTLAPVFGIALNAIFDPGYKTVSPAYIAADRKIDNNGLSGGIAPNIGAIIKLSDKLYILPKGGWAVQFHKNSHKPNDYNLYQHHFFSELALKIKL